MNNYMKYVDEISGGILQDKFKIIKSELEYNFIPKDSVDMGIIRGSYIKLEHKKLGYSMILKVKESVLLTKIKLEDIFHAYLNLLLV